MSVKKDLGLDVSDLLRITLTPDEYDIRDKLYDKTNHIKEKFHKAAKKKIEVCSVADNT